MGSIRVGVLLRHDDESGVSGTGIVADIIEYRDGSCAMHWRSEMPTTTVFNNIKSLAGIHGHGGKTEVVFYEEFNAPKTLDDLKVLLREGPSEEERVEELAEEVAEEVAEHLKEQATVAAKKILQRRAKEEK